MRTLNQAVGRALRHANDYACILLVDNRFNSNKQIQAKLPGWIQQRLIVSLTSAEVSQQVQSFYESKL